MTSDDQTECPLCMELLEVDDLSFYPCTCGYQICRFCWHRLKTDGNGLCPACRKGYSENPAHFEPLSEDEILRIKKERRQKELQKKQKLSENRRHLADVRVVQKNLVFIVGLSQRLADIEVLKKHEYFGKFGKILKVVVNPSPSYAGTQTPSASAYVTYSKPEEALRAIQTVNNVQVDNRTLKASLGTTKYCSHFLKSTYCPKADCMYLHDFGEDAASFTKEEMSQGKHLEYEAKLIETVLHIPRNLQNISSETPQILSWNPNSTASTNSSVSPNVVPNSVSPNPSTNQANSISSTVTNSNTNVSIVNNTEKNEVKMRNKTKTNPINQNRTSKSYNNKTSLSSLDKIYPDELDSDPLKTVEGGGCDNFEENDQLDKPSSSSSSTSESSSSTNSTSSSSDMNPININKLNEENELESSPNSDSNTSDELVNKLDEQNTNGHSDYNNHLIKKNETIIVDPTINNHHIAQNNFNIHHENDFLIHHNTNMFQEEDLGFDPWCESTRALQDLMQIEKTTTTNGPDPKRNFQSQNQILNSNHLSNKNILSHIEFLQKQFDNPNNINIASNANTNMSNNSILNENTNKNILNTLVNNNNNINAKSNIPIQMPYTNIQVNTFLSQANELLSSPIKNLINSNQNLFNKKLAELNNLNQTTFLNQDNSANTNSIQNFSDFLNNAKSNITHAFLNNHTNINTANNTNMNINNNSNSTNFNVNNRNQNINLLRNGGGSVVIPPPGFGASNSNNFQTSSSSTSSSSSSTSSSVENSASSTPALNSNALPNNKSVPNSYSSTVKEPPKLQQSETSTEKLANHLNLKQDLNDISIQNSFQNGTHQFNNLLDENSPLIQNETLNLHKTLKSILPHANISFGTNNNVNINNNTNLNANLLANNFLANKNIQQFGSGLNGENRMPLLQQQQDQRNFWPDDPAIVSLTDRSHSLANGNFNGVNNGGLGKPFNELQYQLANNSNNISNNRSLSPSFLNALSSMHNNNNKNQSNINNLKLNQQRLNGEQQQQLQQQQQFLNNQYFQNFNTKIDDNLNNLAQPFLNRLQSFNNLNGLNTNNNDNTNTNTNGYSNNLFSANLLNDQLSQLVINQDNGMNTLNMASLSLHQQFLMQQLTANFAAKKMQSE